MPKKAAKKSLGKAFDISTVFDSIVVKLRVPYDKHESQEDQDEENVKNVRAVFRGLKDLAVSSKKHVASISFSTHSEVLKEYGGAGGEVNGWSLTERFLEESYGGKRGKLLDNHGMSITDVKVYSD